MPALWTPGLIWAEHTIFILGGGPSLAEERDLGFIPAGRILSTNFGIELRPDAAVELWADNTFMERALPLLKAYRGIKITRAENGGTARADLEDMKFYQQIDGALSTEPGKICGSTSGHQAINLALQLGAARIVLLGFDGGRVHDRMNFHEHYDPRFASHDFYETRWNQELFDLSRAVKRRFPGVDIFNCSPVSSLTFFPHRSLKEFLP